MNARRVRGRQQLGAAVRPDVLRIVAHQPVAFANHAVLDLAGGSDLEPLCSGLLGLHLRHFHLLRRTRASQKVKYRQWFRPVRHAIGPVQHIVEAAVIRTRP